MRSSQQQRGARQQVLPAPRHTAFLEGGKPSPRIIRKAMEEIGAKPEYTAMVGDKLLTDVCARRCGITAILVKPVGGRGVINYIRHKQN